MRERREPWRKHREIRFGRQVLEIPVTFVRVGAEKKRHELL
jgi:hypothetical protein